MSAGQQAVASLQTLGNATTQHPLKCATGDATGRATGSLKALAIKALRTQSTKQSVQQGRNTGATSDAAEVGISLQPVQRLPALPWPEPEPFPLVVRSVPWKYACLFAIASVYGAGLTKDAGGTLILACPDKMPQGAAQAAQEGLSELAEYIQVLLVRGAS